MTTRPRTRLLVHLSALFVFVGLVATVNALADVGLVSREDGLTEARLVERLMAEHGCWSGDGPDVIPSWAIVEEPGEPPRRAPAEVGFEIWQEQRPGRVYGFCR